MLQGEGRALSGAQGARSKTRKPGIQVEILALRASGLELSTFWNESLVAGAMAAGGAAFDRTAWKASARRVDWALVPGVSDDSPARGRRKLRQPDPHAAGRHPRQRPAFAGLTEALREFCDFRGLLPRGMKLAPEDVWDGVSLSSWR